MKLIKTLFAKQVKLIMSYLVFFEALKKMLFMCICVNVNSEFKYNIFRKHHYGNTPSVRRHIASY